MHTVHDTSNLPGICSFTFNCQQVFQSEQLLYVGHSLKPSDEDHMSVSLKEKVIMFAQGGWK